MLIKRFLSLESVSRFLVKGCQSCILLTVLLPYLCQAADAPVDPILRVETDMHTAFIKKLSVDRVNNRLVSVSDDKTARVWDLATGRLLRTLRVPIQPQGHEGGLQVGAVAPDGKSVVVGGYTGLGWSKQEQNATLYFFDLNTGEMAANPLPKIPMTVENLAYSDDGRFLAICLYKKNNAALLIYDTERQVFIKTYDHTHNKRVYGIDFSPDGRLVTTAVDGFIRLYGRDFNLVKQRRLGGRPFHAYFSPDGNEIAVGFDGLTRVDILSSADLALLHSPDLAGLNGQKNLIAVNWSPSGGILYAGGETVSGRDVPVYYWRDKGRGQREKFDTRSSYRISDLHTLNDGKVVFSTGEPSVGLTEAEGKPIWLRNSDTANFQRAFDAFCVSEDGATIEYPQQTSAGRKIMRFTPLDWQDPQQSDSCQFKSPILSMPGLHLHHWDDDEHPVLNNQPLANLDEYESAKSYAIAPDGKQFILGTSWSLRLYDHHGKQLWRRPLSQMAWAVNITANGRLAVAALSDGTIRWYRMSDGEERFAYFPFYNRNQSLFEGTNTQEWIAWTPNGTYSASEQGDFHIGFHFNRDKTSLPEFFRSAQFERLLYKPTDVANYFNCLIGKTHSGCEAAGLDKVNKELAASKPPRVNALLVEEKVNKDQVDAKVNNAGQSAIRLQVTATRTSSPMQDFTVFVNDIPVTPTAERKLSNAETEKAERDIPLALFDQDNVIRVEVSGGNAIGVQELVYRLPPHRQIQAKPKGNLYLLTIGVNNFPKLDSSWQLNYAAKDADAIAEALEELGKAYFDDVKVMALSDNLTVKPEKAEIIKALQFIQSAGADDTTIVFLSSHGLSTYDQNFYFLPSDAEPDEVNRIKAGQPGAATSLISREEFFEAMRKTAGKRLLLVDTCKAKSIVSRFDAQWLTKHSASSHFASMVSSKGTESSQEYSKIGHGLFTYYLLEGLRTGCGGKCQDFITLEKLFAFTEKNVELRVKSQNFQTEIFVQQTPMLTSPDSLFKMVLGKPVEPTWSFTNLFEHFTSFFKELWSTFKLASTQ